MSVVFASLSGQRICSASQALSEFDRMGFDTSVFEGRANSYRCPLGPDPGQAFLLMLRSNLNELTPTSFKTLTLGVGSEQVEIPDLCLYEARRIVPGKSHDSNALYLLELRDKRFLLQRTGIINKRYNVREWEDVEDVYREGTINDETEDPWTWGEIFEDLWDEMDADLAGAYEFEGLDPELDSTPENLFYENISAWDALSDAVRRCGCELKLDPTTGTVSIIQMGIYESSEAPTWFDAGGTYDASDSGWGAVNGSRTPRQPGDFLTGDDETLFAPWRIPKKVRVVFPSNYPHHDESGSGYSYLVTGSTLDLGSYWTVDAIADGYNDSEEVIHDGMMARYRLPTSGQPENQTELVDRAKEVARDFYIRFMSGTPESLDFSGIKPYLPGPNIHATTWGDVGDGMRTWIDRRSPKPVTLLPRRDFPVRTSRGVKLMGVRIENTDGTISLEGGFKYDGNTALGGTYKLSWRGNRTETIEITDTGSTVESKLAALSNIGSGNITATGGPLPDEDIVIYFSGDLFEENADEIKVHYGRVTGGYLPGITVGDGVPCAILEGGGDISYDVVEGQLTSVHWAPALHTTMVRDGDDWYISPSYAMYGCSHAGYSDDDEDLLVQFGLSQGGEDFSTIRFRAENISTEDDADWEEQNRDLWAYPFNGIWKVLPQDCPPEDQEPPP